VSFPTDLEKSKACVISGESGSGKSWFAKRYIPSKFPNASVISYELADTDQAEWNDMATPEDTSQIIYRYCIKALRDAGQMGSKVFHAVCELSRRNNSCRNQSAINLMVTLVQRALKSSALATSWWKYFSNNENNCQTTLDQLIIILDEIGKVPQFALGLVDEVRNILITLQYRGLARHTMLVLVGSGLDGYIEESSPDFSVLTIANFEEYRALQSFGTDPSKSDLIRLSGPILDDRKIGKVKLEDIKKGTYSKILATNTRMLFRGVIPIMMDEKHVTSVDDISSRRIELGSTNIVMDYSARKYKESSPKKLTKDTVTRTSMNLAISLKLLVGLQDTMSLMSSCDNPSAMHKALM
jgi:predicted kinase